MNKTLEQQLKQVFGSLENVPKGLDPLCQLIENTYDVLEEEKKKAEQTGDIGLQELTDLNKSLREEVKVLKENQVVLATAHTLAHLGSWEWYVNTDVLIWSDEQLRLFGERRESFSSNFEGYLSHLSPEERVRTKAVMDKALAGDGEYAIEHEITRGDGVVRIMQEQGRVVFGEDKKPVRVFGTSQDVTERRQAERALQESEERFRILAAASPIGIFQTDPKGAATYLNKRLVDIFGMLTEQEGLGDGWMHFLHPEDRADVVAAWKSSTQGGQTFEKEFRVIQTDGDIRYVHVQARPTFDYNKDSAGYVGSVDDITERKRAEEKLRDALETSEKMNRVMVNRELKMIELKKQISELKQRMTGNSA